MGNDGGLIKKYCSIALLLFGFIFPFFDRPCFAENAKTLYEERLDHGLTNNDAYSFFLMEGSGGSSEKKDLLKQAMIYSPDLPAPYFKIAYDRIDFSFKGIFEAVDYIRKGIRSYERNLLWRFNLWGLLTKSLIISFLLAVFFLIIVRFQSQAAVMMHEIKEDRKKNLLLLLPIIFSIFGLLPLLVSLLSLYGLYMKKRDRIVIYVAFLIIFFLSLLPDIVNVFSVPPHIRAAIAVNEGRDNKYGLWRLKGRDDLVSSFAHALALKREGYYKESVDIYKNLAERYRLPEIYINLGNSLYASGNIDGAIEYYSKSLSIRPIAAAYYNLSQVYRELLDFKRGEEYFEEAARLDPESLRRYTLISGRNPNRFVMDVKLPDSLIRSQIVSEKGGLIRLTLTTIVTLFAILSFFIIDRVLRNRAERCRKCGSIYCRGCSRLVTWKEMCSNCYRSLVRMEQMYSKDRVANLLLMYKNRARKRTVARLLSLFIPGAGQIYSGRMIWGFLFCWSFFFALTGLILNSIMREGIYPFHHDILVLPLVLAIIVLYGLSNIHIRRGIQKGWL